MNEIEKAISGLEYNSRLDGMPERRKLVDELCLKFNNSLDDDERADILKELLSEQSQVPFLQGPIHFSYGWNISFGSYCFANFNLVINDPAKVEIGDNVQIGPNCTIATALHPMRWQDRNRTVDENGQDLLRETAKPVTIGSNCWISSSVTICPGVTIGEGSVIGAGSLVLHDIPAGVFAAGVPCKVIKPIE